MINIIDKELLLLYFSLVLAAVGGCKDANNEEYPVERAVIPVERAVIQPSPQPQKPANENLSSLYSLTQENNLGVEISDNFFIFNNGTINDIGKFNRFEQKKLDIYNATSEQRKLVYGSLDLINDTNLIEAVVFAESSGKGRCNRWGACGEMQVKKEGVFEAIKLLYSDQIFCAMYDDKIEQRKEIINQLTGNYFVELADISEKLLEKREETNKHLAELENIINGKIWLKKEKEEYEKLKKDFSELGKKNRQLFLAYRLIEEGYSFTYDKSEREYNKIKEEIRNLGSIDKLMEEVTGLERDWFDYFSKQPVHLDKMWYIASKTTAMNLWLGDTVLANNIDYFKDNGIDAPEQHALRAYNEGRPIYTQRLKENGKGLKNSKDYFDKIKIVEKDNTHFHKQFYGDETLKCNKINGNHNCDKPDATLKYIQGKKGKR